MVYTKTIIHLSVGESGGYLPPLRRIIVNYPYIVYAAPISLPYRKSRLSKIMLLDYYSSQIYGDKDTESALPLLNLLDMLTVYNNYSLHVLRCLHRVLRARAPMMRALVMEIILFKLMLRCR